MAVVEEGGKGRKLGRVGTDVDVRNGYPSFLDGRVGSDGCETSTVRNGSDRGSRTAGRRVRRRADTPAAGHIAHSLRPTDVVAVGNHPGPPPPHPGGAWPAGGREHPDAPRRRER